jgi:hypothetical protein
MGKLVIENRVDLRNVIYPFIKLAEGFSQADSFLKWRFEIFFIFLNSWEHFLKVPIKEVLNDGVLVDVSSVSIIISIVVAKAFKLVVEP